MAVAIRLYRVACTSFNGIGADRGGRLVLSLFFKAVLGVQRIFHFDSITDVGFAVLTGGLHRSLSRHALGARVRAVSTRAVGQFLRATQPAVKATQAFWISIDEHVIPRFTRKFLIRKGFHTIRNKHMRVEKLFFSFEVGKRSLLDLVVTRGDGRLARVANTMLASLRARAGRGPARIVLDAGAAQSHRELLELADAHENQVIIVRAPRRTAYRKRWMAIPLDQFEDYDEPGRYTRAAAKRIHVTETTTLIRASSKSPPRAVRTIVVREEKRRGKDRWHALFVFRDNVSSAMDLIKEFRERQHHEQTYRVMLHDAFVDTAPSGYNKKSPNPDRPGFRKNAITLYAWATGLAVNTLSSFTAELPKRFHFAHPRTLRRWWFNFPADLYLTPKVLIVLLHPRWHRGWWELRVSQLNAKNLRVPWLADRLVRFSVAARGASEPSSDPPAVPQTVWC
jgi:hypothetical protein